MQLKDLGDDWMQGFIPLPPFPKEREQETGQKHLWPTTPAIIPTPPCYARAAVSMARGPWRYGASTQSKSTGWWSPSCHHPEDIRAFVFPVSHPFGGSYQVTWRFSHFSSLIILYVVLWNTVETLLRVVLAQSLSRLAILFRFALLWSLSSQEVLADSESATAIWI